MGGALVEALSRLGDTVIKALPAGFVRALLFVVLIVAGFLHWFASERITALERSHDALQIQNVHVLNALNDLAAEVRGYRADIREENKALRERTVIRK